MDRYYSLLSQNAGVILFGSLAMANMVLSKGKSSRALIAGRGARVSRSAAERDGIIKKWQEKDGIDSWLEQVDSEKSLTWVKGQNDICFGTLGKPEDSPFYSETLKILDSKEKIPYVSKIGDFYYNFWQDDEHRRGIWRRCTLLKFKSKNPVWETVLDLDSLNEKEGESWVWKGYVLYKPDPESADEGPSALSRAMVRLSRGGADATVVREFDLLAKSFVADGFQMPEAKSSVSWKDINTLIVGTDFGDGNSVTDSGYPRTVREWKRGTTLSDSKQIQEGAQTDVSVTSWVDKHRGHKFQFCCLSHTFYTETLLVKLQLGSWVKVPKPEDSDMMVFADKFILRLRSDWKINDKTTFKTGSVVAVDGKELIQKAEKSNFTVLFEPTARSSLDSMTHTYNYVVLQTLDNVLSKVIFWKFSKDKGWVLSSEEPQSSIRSISLSAVDDMHNDWLWMTTFSFLNTTRLSTIDAKNGAKGIAEAKVLKSLPPQFNDAGLTETQYEATSEDGTKIPYFIVSKKDTKLDGSNPTLLYGYGGFMISMTPGYAAVAGKLWLERGGVYVVANIRGGGEFGPGWHKAALKENRKLAYDDFIAVAEDLISRKITSSAHLGIRGGSNGGLLMGNMITRRPDLWGAVICQVPLLDMYRYNRLLAGASWMAEYGNPEIPEEWDYLKRYSAYHNIDPEATFPALLVTTSTRDDRVHPYHARAFVRRILETKAANGNDKNSILYYENMEGGHGGAADNKQQAVAQALVYTFLWKTLAK